MAQDDYLPPTTGGSLRLKGAKDGGITKKKKRKKTAKAPTSPSPGQRAGSAETGAETGRSAGARLEDSTIEATAVAKERGVNPLREEREEGEEGEEGEDAARVYKTEAERRHEETRRKRLDERLKREGVKTHKERVEELNRYLSNLSEHHDMPRIGPG